MTLTAKESMQHISPDQIRDKPRNAAQPHSPALQGNVYFFFFFFLWELSFLKSQPSICMKKKIHS